MEVDEDCFEITKWEVTLFSLSCFVKNRRDNIAYRITTVYGPIYNDKKNEFIKSFMKSIRFEMVLP